MNLKNSLKATTFIGVLFAASILPAADVVLVPAYISGAIRIGDIPINRATINASSGQQSSSMSSKTGNYTLTVNVPESGSLLYDVDMSVYSDNSNDQLTFKRQSITASDGETSVLDFVVTPGIIEGTITVSDAAMTGGHIYAQHESNGNYTNASTRLSSNGAFSFPVQPNANIQLTGSVTLDDGRSLTLDNKLVSVDANGTVNVNWSLVAPPLPTDPTPGSVTGEVVLSGVSNIDRHYVWVNGPSFQTTNMFGGNGIFTINDLDPGNYKQFVISYLNNNDDELYHPDSGFEGGRELTVISGSTVTKNVYTDSASFNGVIKLGGSKGWGDIDEAIMYASGVNGTASQGSSSTDLINTANGQFDLVLTEGDWTINRIYLSFFNGDVDNYLESTLTYYDYRRPMQTLAKSQTLNGQDVEYKTGTVTLNYYVKGGGTLSNPLLTANCSKYDASNRIEQKVAGRAEGAPGETTLGKVTFVGMPMTCQLTPKATVGGAEITPAPIEIDIEPGTDKVIELGGPALTITSPAPEAFVSGPVVTVSGLVTDDLGVASVTVNGVEVPVLSTNNPSDANEVAFSTELALHSGTNVIEVVALDTSGSMAKETRRVYRDAGAPTLEWTPADGASTTESVVTVQGVASDDTGITAISVNGTAVNFTSSNNSLDLNEVTFTTTVNLAEGANQIVVSATDDADLVTSQTHTVSKTTAQLPPVAHAGPDQLVECAAALTAVTLDGSASSDPEGDSLSYAWSGVFGSASGVSPTVELGLGTHTINLTVSDGAADSSDSVQVNVVDKTAPTVDAGQDVTLVATSPEGAAYSISPSASDSCSSVTLSVSPELGVYPIGSTTVVVTATDSSNNSAQDSVTITVIEDITDTDTTPPDFVLEVLHDVLWPPNHKMVLAARVSNVSDDRDTAPNVSIAIGSNQADTGNGAGNTSPDWYVVNNGGVHEIWLRAERSGGLGARVYSISVNVADASANSSDAQATVTVPHDQGTGGGGKGGDCDAGKNKKKYLRCDSDDADSDSDTDSDKGDTDSDSDSDTDSDKGDTDSDSDDTDTDSDKGDTDSDSDSDTDSDKGDTDSDSDSDTDSDKGDTDSDTGDAPIGQPGEQSVAELSKKSKGTIKKAGKNKKSKTKKAGKSKKSKTKKAGKSKKSKGTIKKAGKSKKSKTKKARKSKKSKGKGKSKKVDDNEQE